MRLVDADELREEILKEDYDNDTINNLLDLVDFSKTVDVEPIKHGRWFLERDPNGNPYCFHCSCCDSDYHHIGVTSATKYCPNCGAKMDIF